MDDGPCALLTEFRLGRSPSPRRSQHGESFDHKENPSGKEDTTTNSPYPRTRVDFPLWEDGDPTEWISCAERYFCYHKTPEASMVDIAAIHLEGEAIQWYDLYKHTHGVPTWRQFKSGLLLRFRPFEYENIDGQLAKIRQTSTVQEYQTRFERLSNQTRDWSEKQLLETFIEGLKSEIQEEVKARRPYMMMAAIFFA
ncbi:hypothetical protein B296_00038775 [Ensete ventricosum]|uniref:Retrotransposon gag domain-containing protein n=1 Tax=Ensete ventricosum TaxID=4639 RepID=A0A426Z568_ENSVE|nr:hypothetical protein B296_00038775 [Ensete ventricosum]